MRISGVASYIAVTIAVATFALHAAVSNNYDFYRDELYFIVCGRHPAFGYVDQPPLIPLLSAASQMLGESRVAIHLIAAVGGSAAVLLACTIVRLLRGGPYAELLAGLSAGFSPIFLALASTLSTSTFEPLAWGLTAFLVMRAVLLEDRRALVVAGVVVGLALEAKFEIPFYIAAIVTGLAFTPQRRLLATREFALGCAVASLMAAPGLAWQIAHGLPMLAVLMNNVNHLNLVLSPSAFAANQALVVNPLLAPIWLAGLVAPFVDGGLARLRCLSLAFIIVFGAFLALHAKNYYLSPAYIAPFAIGAVALERWLTAAPARSAYLAAAFVSTAIFLPLSIPMLPPLQYLAYEHALGLHAAPVETRAQSRIPQLFADMTGWRELVRSVGTAYARLPPRERARATIFTHNYGEASAIDVLGAPLGLPDALSGHNNYHLWGPGRADGDVLLLVGAKLETVRGRCLTSAVVGRFGVPYALPEEHGEIVLCRHLRPDLRATWNSLQHYD